ncbi:DUF1642 domain-containing protein [Lacticaseibacillus rhamnosus]|uniref:DUF1642 domain-containing protein n=1 Tax=Lacticaseibacillus rhamnosus TaxID=47715 RepID=UPI00194EF851|nr:DUF1642 domain-containing protein [Lacticaseibacillus rhamnosus]MBM6441430.1 DUF1642 domain-containing protein [Lacticaseibacillus rhamnosus]
MSEEKLYAVKNDEGKYWEFFDNSGFWTLDISDSPITPSKYQAEQVANEHGGHVVTLVEEPEKVAVSPNEAQAIESLLNADTYADVYDPFQYLFTSRYKKDIKRLIKAIKNGYTVAKEKKYLLPMDGTLEENDDNDNFQLYAYCYKGRWLVDEVETDPSYKHQTVTQKELETAPAWVKAIKPLEVDDDDD